MEISREGDEVVISDLNHTLCEILRWLVPSAQRGPEKQVRERFFPAPMADEEEAEELVADWREFVEPDLEAGFQAHLSVVEAALQNFPPAGEPEPHTLRIPMAQLEPWIHAVNQARMGLAMRYNLSSEHPAPRPTDDHAQVVRRLQMAVYDFLLDTLVQYWDE